MIQEISGTSWKEMYKVFNMGHRMELYIPGRIADEIIKIASAYHIQARIIGQCELASGKSLVIANSPPGEIIFDE